MRTSTAAVGSAMFFIVAPGTVVGLIPWLISHWEFHQPAPHWVIAQAIGALLICVGLVPAVSAFVEFVKAGGTPMPVAPPQRLVARHAKLDTHAAVRARAGLGRRDAEQGDEGIERGRDDRLRPSHP